MAEKIFLDQPLTNITIAILLSNMYGRLFVLDCVIEKALYLKGVP